MMEALAFTALMAIFANDPLELSVGQLPDGRIVVVALVAGPPNTTELHSFVQVTPGPDLQPSNFVHTQFDSGQIFSISPELVLASGFLYMAAVCNADVACLYRLDTGTLNWENSAAVALAALGTTPIQAVTLALLGGQLAMVAQTVNTLYFMTANPALAMNLISFAILNTIANVAGPFEGGTKASVAIDPGSGDRCIMYRQLISAVLIGNLVAQCFSGSSAATNLITLAVLSTAAGFVNSIESRAVFAAGAFYFMYFLASGAVQLAAIADPLTAVTATIVQLGLINLAAGFPSMALVLGPLGETLYAYWPGNAVAITLLTLAVAQINGFPLTQTGPIAALLLTTILLNVAIFGTGSVAGTVMGPGLGAPGALGIPTLEFWALALLAALLLLLAWRRFHGADATRVRD